ncbi:hypothetical protein G9A89_014248 [Geosiphon pyriformis]|nr:hypothetical protein G9A89_014248 [Geosiphon pyriformis]
MSTKDFIFADIITHEPEAEKLKANEFNEEDVETSVEDKGTEYVETFTKKEKNNDDANPNLSTFKSRSVENTYPIEIKKSLRRKHLDCTDSRQGSLVIPDNFAFEQESKLP